MYLPLFSATAVFFSFFFLSGVGGGREKGVKGGT